MESALDVRKDRESAVSDPFDESRIFRPKLALGRLWQIIFIHKSYSKVPAILLIWEIWEKLKVRSKCCSSADFCLIKKCDDKPPPKSINLLHYQCFNLFKYDSTMVFQAIQKTPSETAFDGGKMQLIFIRIKMFLVCQFLTIKHCRAKIQVSKIQQVKFQGRTLNASLRRNPRSLSNINLQNGAGFITCNIIVTNTCIKISN